MSLDSTSPIQGITLYSHIDDFRSHWIRFLLEEKRIQYQLILVEDESEDLASLNPYNQLPMLLENKLKLFFSPIIAEYLDDRYRQNKLYADSPAARAEQRQYILRFEQDWFKQADIILKHPDSLDLKQSQRTQKHLSDTLISLTPLFQYFPYFMSENFNILDSMLAPMFLRLHHIGIDFNQPQFRALLLYCNRVFSRPAFVKSMTQQEKTRYSKLVNREY